MISVTFTDSKLENLGHKVQQAPQPPGLRLELNGRTRQVGCEKFTQKISQLAARDLRYNLRSRLNSFFSVSKSSTNNRLLRIEIRRACMHIRVIGAGRQSRVGYEEDEI